ncbi:adenylate kinase family protein [Micromonospora sp. LOL_021]|uniref:adenylate kinase family protein n=1 Tax=Micromonospora sp. LOL_021 TaxID=3345417 RepID=UPI003A8C78A1
MNLSVVLLGPPGVGKGTLAGVLARRFGATAINSGALLRAEVGSGSDVGLCAAGHIRRGDLVPDEIVFGLLRRAVLDKDGRLLVIDGFPRTVTQAEMLTALLSGVGSPVGLVVDLVADRATLRQRMLARAGVNLGKDTTGSRRDDDQPTTIERRLDAFGSTPPELLSYFRNGTAVATVDGRRPKDEVAETVGLLLSEVLAAGGWSAKGSFS